MSAIESALNLTDDDEVGPADAGLPAPARSSEAGGYHAVPQAEPNRQRCAGASSRKPLVAFRPGERSETGDPCGDARK